MQHVRKAGRPWARLAAGVTLAAALGLAAPGLMAPVQAAPPPTPAPPAAGAARGPAPIVVRALDFSFQVAGPGADSKQPAGKAGGSGAGAPLAVTASGGELLFRVTNAGMVEHNFVIWDASERTVDEIPVLAPGETQELRVRLKPGNYRAVCTYPGHRDLGMEFRFQVN